MRWHPSPTTRRPWPPSASSCAPAVRLARRWARRWASWDMAARKHNVTVAGLAPLAETMTEQLAALDDGEAGLEKLASAAKAKRAEYVAAAGSQAAARRKGAAKLDKAVAAELGPLKLEKAKFV